ncbi:hypothetical protein PEL8287_02332 [Roseovarius litorisediminis]|uniref:Uncharacterized protein n=1 Tax=Roseovarius litorisediminis TaxID=1312363 RepID=A0A1Y5SRS2_9RHOB|nr:carboxymuconolactone decarboxylase family protein [Roseovarius litorisediminis]SLN45461.1 hypothetical protein PEL8287_02332 [Roseovarius litorisediminis]
MIKALLHRMLRKFESDFDYDASYMHEVTDAWPGGSLRYLGLSIFSQTRGPEAEIWAGAVIASTLEGDCGPCAQLVVNMAVKAGVDPDQIAACLRRDFERAGAVGLAFRFAEAAIHDRPEVDTLRVAIFHAYGQKAVIAASYAAASGRVYPVLKRGLGHGQACQQIRLGDTDHTVVRLTA